MAGGLVAVNRSVVRPIPHFFWARVCWDVRVLESSLANRDVIPALLFGNKSGDRRLVCNLESL